MTTTEFAAECKDDIDSSRQFMEALIERVAQGGILNSLNIATLETNCIIDSCHTLRSAYQDRIAIEHGMLLSDRIKQRISELKGQQSRTE